MNIDHAAVIIEKLDTFSDERGLVFNPIGISEFRNQKNLHVVTSVPQAIRGNHYHPRGTEIITVMGPAVMRIREKDTLRDITIPDRAIFRLTIPPGVPHAIKHTGSEIGVLLSFNSLAYDPEKPDVVRDVLM